MLKTLKINCSVGKNNMGHRSDLAAKYRITPPFFFFNKRVIVWSLFVHLWDSLLTVMGRKKEVLLAVFFLG